MMDGQIKGTRPFPTWQEFIAWAKEENVYQKQIAGAHPDNHPNPELRGRTYFEVNLYRYYHCLGVCWPFLTQGTHKAARLQNLAGMLAGGGMAGNLDELLPRGGGQLGAWRPHAREYVWQELNHVAMKSGFAHIAHGFYQENYGLKLIEGTDKVDD